jgi:peroxiredoxin
MTPDRKSLSIITLAVSLFFAATGLASALEVGDKAPDFELDSTAGGKLKLSSLRGKTVLLNFYQLDFNPA